MERWEVERIVREELERLLKVQFRFCPTCKEDVRMIEVDRGEGPTTWRCLGCLKQYKETLIPIVVPPQPPEEKTISPWAR